MNKLIALSLWYALSQAALVQTNASDPIIDLGFGSYRGVHKETTGINAFYGIRYAPSPTGELRWRPPQNDEELRFSMSRGEIIDATKPGPRCFQGNPGWRGQGLKKTKSVEESEDCLRLDVLVPANPSPGAPLAVMVQIHGGGYAGGDSGTSPGDALVVHANNSLIYVSIQYRLGPLGFLSSKAVKADGSANVGLLDQRAALDWVQRHISVFGGDPERVTIIGGSAGGGSVTAQMMLFGGAPGNDKPPFSAAIAEYPWWQPFHGDNILEAQYSELLQAAGCSDLACLRNATESVLAAAAARTYSLGYNRSPPLYGYGDFYWGPAVDGEIIRDLPSREFRRGAFSSVPFLTNRETYEGYVFSNQSESTLEEETTDLRNLFPNADDKFFSQLYELYPSSEFNSTFWQRQTLFGDFIINCPTRWVSEAVELLGKPAFKMIFNAGNQLHSATGQFLFDPTYGTSPNDDITLANQMKDWYISFAVHHDPNRLSPHKVTWPSYNSRPPKTNEVLIVNSTAIGVGVDPEANVRWPRELQGRTHHPLGGLEHVGILNGGGISSPVLDRKGKAP